MLIIRPIFFLGALLFLVSCGEGDEQPGATAGSPLEIVTRTAFSDAFQTLDEQGYVAELTYGGGPSGSPGPESRFLIRVEDGDIHMLEAPEGDSDTLDLRMRNPLPEILPDDPPYLDPRTRDYYTLSTQEKSNGTLIVGELDAESNQNLPIRRVEALMTDGHLTHVQIDRRSESLLLDESERVEVQLAPINGAWIPSRVVLETTVDLPGNEPVSRMQSWKVLEIGGALLEQ